LCKKNHTIPFKKQVDLEVSKNMTLRKIIFAYHNMCLFFLWYFLVIKNNEDILNGQVRGNPVYKEGL